MSEKEDLSNVHQIAPLLPPSYNSAVGLDCLRMVDSLYIKQRPSLSESKSF